VEPFRVEPALPPAAMKTYAVVVPRETHFRRATCVEVNCRNYQCGWQTRIDEDTVLGRQQAYYIRRQSGRRFQEVKAEGLTVFVFEQGQQCFAQHEVPLERDPVFLVRGGDWRGNPLGVPPRVHRRAEDWVEDFAEHQQKLADRIKEG
jgi:hypothetical protein